MGGGVIVGMRLLVYHGVVAVVVIVDGTVECRWGCIAMMTMRRGSNGRRDGNYWHWSRVLNRLETVRREVERQMSWGTITPIADPFSQLSADSHREEFPLNEKKKKKKKTEVNELRC